MLIPQYTMAEHKNKRMNKVKTEKQVFLTHAPNK